MSIQAGLDPLTLAVSFLTGGGIATLLTIFNNRLLKKRQERMEISKVKIEIITKVAPLYNQLALHNSWNLSQILLMPAHERDAVRMMYHMCNIMNIRRQINKQVGDIQLDNLESEIIIGNLSRDIISSIDAHFGFIDSSRLLHLVDNDIPYHKFNEEVSSNDGYDLYQKFVHWIYREEVVIRLERSCKWLAELIMYEMNYVYRIWYDELPDMFKLSPDLMTFLSNNHQKYYKRIINLETGSYLR